ncbi:hypothetical protein [Thermoplasma acidophilum]|uniref:Uncharacterized protein n=1 Tax=Thermoplasma acidophilum (strain ATCC 25905 / DSM 1728 / JCM 9062 / NBRC 15155 / AMRC-C165) TaxID=273075 RepID=Q9HIR7_THEAC|nr:hypothetical protein [Thermoplasma acidophilum]
MYCWYSLATTALFVIFADTTLPVRTCPLTDSFPWYGQCGSLHSLSGNLTSSPILRVYIFLPPQISQNSAVFSQPVLRPHVYKITINKLTVNPEFPEMFRYHYPLSTGIYFERILCLEGNQASPSYFGPVRAVHDRYFHACELIKVYHFIQRSL